MGIYFNFAVYSNLARRYTSVFVSAWKVRKQLDPQQRLPHESQFLPAALSLQETPVSPAPRITMWVLMLFAALAILWAILGHVDIVSTAQGKVLPSDRVKIIQSLETASIRAIHVRDGMFVKAGAPLVDLDNTTADADKNQVTSEMEAIRLQITRARAMANLAETNSVMSLVRPDGVSVTAFNEAQKLFQGQASEYRAKLSRIDAEAKKRSAELRSAFALIRKLEQTIPIARQKADDFRTLADKHYVSQHAYLERYQTQIEQEADLASMRSRVREMEASLSEARAQRSALVAETIRSSLEEATAAETRLASLEQSLRKAASRENNLRLTSPVDGTIQQLSVHTVGGVVTPAQPLMIIVPKDDLLEVEAFIENKDIGFIKPGQVAEIKVHTYQYTKYGTIPAEVTSISHDAVSDEKQGLVYSAKLRIDRPSLRSNGKDLPLFPGMAVSVEIKTGTRRLIEFFLSPLIQHHRESMRER